MSFRSSPQYALRRGGRTLPIEQLPKAAEGKTSHFGHELPTGLSNALWPPSCSDWGRSFIVMAIMELQSPDLKVACLADSIVERYDDSERRGHLRLSADDLRW